MRIVFVALHFSEYAWNLVQALSVKHQVMAIFNAKNFEAELGFLPPSQPLINLQVLLLSHQQSVRTVLKNAYKIASEVRNFKPDVIHYQEGGKDCFILALPWIKNYPLTLTIHDPQPHTGSDHSLHRWHRHGLYVHILRRICDVAIVHGDYLKLITESLLPRLKGRVYAVLHGPLGPWDQQPDHNWEPGNLIFFGRMEAYKGLGYFIAAVQELARRGFSVKGVIAGRGPDLDRYRELIDGNSLYEVHDGFVPRAQVAELFKRANIVVLPYVDGTQSGVAAMAIGFARPVVASEVGSIPEMVRDGVNGHTFPLRDEARLVEALAKLIGDQSEAVRMANNAWALCNDEISWSILARKTILVYEDAIYLKAKIHGC